MEKKRYITVIHKSIKHLIFDGVFSLDFIRFWNNIADLFTKGLACQRVIQLSREMRLNPLN
jgi:hypothetical protein